MSDVPHVRVGHVDAARVILYQNDKYEWCWTARDTNHEEVANSGDDGYVEYRDALNAARDLFPDAEIVELASG